MFLAKIILFLATTITPAEMIDEEEMLLTKKAAMIEEEVCDGELLFEDNPLTEEEDEFFDLELQ